MAPMSAALVTSKRTTAARVAFDSALSRLGCSSLVSAIGGSVRLEPGGCSGSQGRRERGSQGSNLESPVLETGALSNLATAPRRARSLGGQSRDAGGGTRTHTLFR